MGDVRHELLAQPVGLLLAHEVVLEHLVGFHQPAHRRLQVVRHLVDALGEHRDLIVPLRLAPFGEVEPRDLVRRPLNPLDRPRDPPDHEIDDHRAHQQDRDRSQRGVFDREVGEGFEVPARGLDIEVEVVVQPGGEGEHPVVVPRVEGLLQPHVKALVRPLKPREHLLLEPVGVLPPRLGGVFPVAPRAHLLPAGAGVVAHLGLPVPVDLKEAHDRVAVFQPPDRVVDFLAVLLVGGADRPRALLQLADLVALVKPLEQGGAHEKQDHHIHHEDEKDDPEKLLADAAFNPSIQICSPPSSRW